MGNWSPYSKEWERQHLQKIIDGAETARLEFERSLGYTKQLSALDKRSAIIGHFC